MSGSHSAWKPSGSRILLLAGILVLQIAAVQWALAQTETVLYSFKGSPNGDTPHANLILDANGTLYGTTLGGGTGPCHRGCGTVFELKRSGKERVLYSFGGVPIGDGVLPRGGLVQDAAGNLYGTTFDGGLFTGTVFKVSPTGVETVLYTFASGADGAGPKGSLLQDAAGNLYGTTETGGTHNYGTVFEISPTGVETVLYNFTGGPDGGNPVAGLIQDAAGNFYGTTINGGTHGPGTVFQLTPGGVETTLASFDGFGLGGNPACRLVRDAAGNLYGTTPSGGAHGDGEVFEVSATGTLSILYSFTGGTDGGNPVAGLIQDAAGNLYGTTTRSSNGAGLVFELTPTGSLKVLYNFQGLPDGGSPVGSLVRDAVGNLYGTTAEGGAYGRGTIFRISP